LGWWKKILLLTSPFFFNLRFFPILIVWGRGWVSF
jgi:hypothetical protein